MEFLEKNFEIFIGGIAAVAGAYYGYMGKKPSEHKNEIEKESFVMSEMKELYNMMKSDLENAKERLNSAEHNAERFKELLQQEENENRRLRGLLDDNNIEY